MFNKNKSSIFALLVLLGFLVGSCIDEPTIAPVKIPYTSLRIGNLTNSVANIDVSIIYDSGDVTMATNLAQGDFTAFQDVTSGQKKIRVVDSATDSVLYEKAVGIQSYAEQSTFFYTDNAGEIVQESRFEGHVYTLNTVTGDSAQLFIFYGLSNVGTDTARAITVEAVQLVDDTTQTLQATILPDPDNRALGQGLPAGNYSIPFIHTADTVIVWEKTLQAQMRYYVYLSGPPTAIQVAEDEMSPLPVRGK